MDDLAQWLGEQLDMDERIARAVTTEGAWRVGSSHGGASVEGEGWTVAGADALDGAHIAEHDPARVLREIDAKRQLLKEHAPGTPKGRPNMERHCLTCSTAQAWDETANEANCLTLRLLAAPYDQRPGYREVWRP